MINKRWWYGRTTADMRFRSQAHYTQIAPVGRNFPYTQTLLIYIVKDIIDLAVCSLFSASSKTIEISSLARIL